MKAEFVVYDNEFDKCFKPKTIMITECTDEFLNMMTNGEYNNKGDGKYVLIEA